MPSGPGPEFRGDRVGAEPGREDLDRPLLAEPVGDLEQPQLGRKIEAVAGLRLDRRCAVGQHRGEPAPAVLGQGLLGGGTSGRDRREDPAAGLEDLEVVRAALAHDELVLAGAREEQVCVRIDQAGRDRSAGGIEAREPGDRVAAAFHRAEQLVARAGGEDPALPARDRRCGIVRVVAARRLDRRDVVHARAGAHAPGERRDFGRVLDDEAGQPVARAAALDQAQGHRCLRAACRRRRR